MRKMSGYSYIKWLGTLILYIFLLFIAVLSLFPELYSLFGSLKSNREIMTSINLIPRKWVPENYSAVWEMVNFSRYTINSIIITLAVVSGAVFTSTMSGYVFSRKDFAGKKLIKGMYLSSIFISLGAATIYPIFKLVVDLKMNNSYLGLILVQIGAQVVNIVLVESYLRGISKEFDEAAIIEGCGFFRIYWSILLPIMKPIIAVVAILTFKAVWNAYLIPLVLTMGRESITPITVAIVQMKSNGEMATEWNLILAGSTISLLPIIAAYIVANRYFIAGLTAGAVKG